MTAKASDVVVAVDLGGTKILAAVVDRAGKVLCRVKVKTPVAAGYRAVLTEIAQCVRGAIKSCRVPRSNILAVGIGVPGPLNPEAGVVKVAPNLGWTDVPVRAILEKRPARFGGQED